VRVLLRDIATNAVGKVLSLPTLLVQKYKYWREYWCKSTNTDAEGAARLLSQEKWLL